MEIFSQEERRFSARDRFRASHSKAISFPLVPMEFKMLPNDHPNQAWHQSRSYRDKCEEDREFPTKEPADAETCRATNVSKNKHHFSLVLE